MSELLVPYIPPELFPLIASFIPLRSAPKTLLALALGNRRFYWIARPLLYSRIIVRSEDAALAAFDRLLEEPQLGIAVTEIHLMAELSKEARERKQRSFDAISSLVHILVMKKLVPRLVALGIYLLDGWTEPVLQAPSFVVSSVQLRLHFWKALRAHCPHLKSLSLRNLGYSRYLLNSWLEGYVIDEIMCIPGLSSLRLECVPNGEGLTQAYLLRAFKNLPQLATSLHTLSLSAVHDKIDPILSIHFLNLKWLRLSKFYVGDQSKVAEFFRRHSQLESLSIMNSISTWFPLDVEDGFLPNLKHFKAPFKEILSLLTILPQLISLSITKSYNCQIPYLLRILFPNGLPGLKSLELNQTKYRGNCQGIGMESFLWYETVEGHFHTETDAEADEKGANLLPRDFKNNYLQSIVRGTPNLEELNLHVIFNMLEGERLEHLAPTLAQLKNMKRFYCDSSIFSEEFIPDVEALGRECASLERVTSISGSDEMLPYLTGIIERNSAGEVIGVRQSDNGVGMEIPAQEDEPFPCNPETFRSRFH